jgi:toxin FitB
VRFLLDTTAASQIGRQRAPEGVRRWLATVRDDEIAVSVLTLGEMRRGIERLRSRDPVAADALDGRLRSMSDALAGRILPISIEVAELWGEIDAARGPLPVIDCLIAATARAYGLVVVTRNVADLARCGVEPVDPWSAPA